MTILSSDAVNQLRRDARSVVRELGLLNDAYFEIGVTLAERHLLIELSHLENPTMGEIADRLLLDKSTVSRLISGAVKKGYIECAQDEKDKRKRILRLTEKGFKTLQAFEPIAYNQSKEALLTLTDREIQTVFHGVALYAEGLKRSRLKQVNNKKTITSISKYDEIIEQLGTMGYVLKPFEQNDTKPLHQIFQEVVGTGSQFHYGCSSIEEFELQFLNHEGQVYVCHFDGEIIGGFYIRENFPGRASHIANAAYMLKECHRGKGVGSLLVQASLHLAKNRGFQAMQYNLVLSKNIRAVNLYEKLGFTILGTIPRAVLNPDNSYQDGYIMYRNINDLN